jgi:hypothetical protein
MVQRGGGAFAADYVVAGPEDMTMTLITGANKGIGYETAAS